MDSVLAPLPKEISALIKDYSIPASFRLKGNKLRIHVGHKFFEAKVDPGLWQVQLTPKIYIDDNVRRVLLLHHEDVIPPSTLSILADKDEKMEVLDVKDNILLCSDVPLLNLVLDRHEGTRWVNLCLTLYGNSKMLALVFLSYNQGMVSDAWKVLNKNGISHNIWYMLNKLQLQNNFAARGGSCYFYNISYEILSRLFTPKEAIHFGQLYSPGNIVQLSFDIKDSGVIVKLLKNDLPRDRACVLSVEVNFPTLGVEDTLFLVGLLFDRVEEPPGYYESYLRDMAQALKEVDKGNAHHF